MRTSEERVKELHRRMKAMRKARILRKYISRCALMSAVCLTTAVGFAAIVAQTMLQVPNQACGVATASIFAEHAVLGYVMVALVALCLGVLVTLFSFRLKQRMEEEEKNDDRKR